MEKEYSNKVKLEKRYENKKQKETIEYFKKN